MVRSSQQANALESSLEGCFKINGLDIRNV